MYMYFYIQGFPYWVDGGSVPLISQKFAHAPPEKINIPLPAKVNPSLLLSKSFHVITQLKRHFQLKSELVPFFF